MSANDDAKPSHAASRYLRWSPATLLDNASALIAATHHGIDHVTRGSDGSLAVHLASPHFHMLVAAGGSVERHLLTNRQGWSEARMALRVGSADVLLVCERLDPHPPAYA